MPDPQIRQGGIPQRHGRRGELILLETRNGCKITELCQSVGEPGNGRLWQFGTGGKLLIAQKPVIGMECAQHIEAAGKRDDEAAIGRHLLGWTLHSLLLLIFSPR